MRLNPNRTWNLGAAWVLSVAALITCAPAFADSRLAARVTPDWLRDSVLAGREPGSHIRNTREAAEAAYPRGALRLRFSDNHDQLRATGQAGLPAALRRCEGRIRSSRVAASAGGATRTSGGS